MHCDGSATPSASRHHQHITNIRALGVGFPFDESSRASICRRLYCRALAIYSKNKVLVSQRGAFLLAPDVAPIRPPLLGLAEYLPPHQPNPRPCAARR
jgi:hypothetical protein